MSKKKYQIFSYYYYKFVLLIIIFIIFINLSFFNKSNNSKNESELIIFKNKNFQNNIFINYSNLTYTFSYKYNIVEIKYYIKLIDEKNNLLKPSDLSRFHKIHVVCHIQKGDLFIVDSLANIYGNTYYCIEYFNIKQEIKFGIKIYVGDTYNDKIIFFTSNIIEYKQNFLNDNKFDPLMIYNDYKILYDKIYNLKNESNLNNSLNIKKMYIKKPEYFLKFKNFLKKGFWYFMNIYNNYFCFCKGICYYSEIPQLCKYLFYITIIDGNKNLYNKTHFLFSDFIFGTSDDAYPIFEEMIKKNMNAHYLDGKKFIYEKICEHEKYCLKVLPIINKREIIDGDFLENYLDIILRLKAVIVGHLIPSFDNIFYNIDYIAYINLGHGIKYFKHFLYNNYTSYKRYNKLVLPSSTKIIDIAKKYGWTDNNIIKLCLPKWDKYNIYKYQIINSREKHNKYIFIMFTWRNLKNNNYSISPSYIKNIFNLLNNDILLSTLKKKNIILYFAFHPNFQKYKNKIKLNKLVKYRNNLGISNCLMKSNLLISDFSSVIFDMIYQNKPYVLFIPDAYDKNIKNLYEEGYYDIINGLKNGTIYFENVFFSINETVKKVIHYIENNFELERKLINFYDSFQLKCNNSLNSFINYLISY